MENVSKYGKLTLLLAAFLLLTGCGGGQQEQTQPAAVETTAVTEAVAAPEETTEAPTEPSIADGMEFAPEEPAGIAVETPYITLNYPEELQGLVEVEQTDEGDSHTVTFRTVIGEEDVVLFSLILGTSQTAEGFPLGQLAHETAGTIYVFAAMNEELPETWSDEEISRFSSMQERVNDLIMQLHEDPRFSDGG